MARGNERRANSHRRNKARARVEARHAPCWMCECPIDYALPWRSPQAYVADELVPVRDGGSPYDVANMAAAHRCCNNWRKAKSVDEVNAIKAAVRGRYGGWSGPLDFVDKAKATMSPRARELRQPKTSTDW